MEIGSIYTLSKLEAEPEGCLSLAGNGAVYFSLCREALWAVARHYGNSQKRVLLPSYTCQTVIDPFMQLGWDICYYNITRELRIDTDSLLCEYDRFSPALCVAHPYYGADLNETELQALSVIKEKGCVLIEDLTQCVFSAQKSPVFDFFMGSYRKWFPIPDGAFLVGQDVMMEGMPENEAFVRSMSDAMYLRGVFHQTGDENIKEISRRVGNVAISYISNSIEPHRMSDFSIGLLSQIDIDETKRKRLENYQYLHQHLYGIDDCEPVGRDMGEVTCAPLFFPIYVKDRAAFQKKLAQKEIYAPVLWPVHTPAVMINDSVKRIYEEILMLPVDQRYGISDMQRMVDVIKS